MKSKPLSLLLTTGLLLFPALSLHAQMDSTLTLALKCYTQQKISVSGTTDIGTIDVYRVDAKQLLSLLKQQLNVSFPKGSQLKITFDGKVFVTDSKANVLRDVSAYLQPTLDQDDRLFQGKRNGDTGQENSQRYFPITLTINLLTLQGTVTGIVIEKYTVTTPNRYGLQRITGQCDSTVNGSGSYNGKLAYFIGSLKLIGKSTE